MTKQEQNGKDEIDDLSWVERAKNGDVHAQNDLLEKYGYLAKSIARRYFLSGGETEDLIQEGLMGLYGAIVSYDPSKGSFKNFATICVKYRIYDTIQAANKKKNKVMNDAVPLPDETLLYDGDPNFGLILEEEWKEFFLKIEKILSPIEFRVMKKYLGGFSLSEICDSENIPPKKADNAIQRAKRKLKDTILKK